MSLPEILRTAGLRSPFDPSLVRELEAKAGSFDTALLYLSDHGESLGEAGMYLHGLPYSIAPDTQKHVPMIAWLSPQFSVANAVDRPCVNRKVADPLTHDNLFHSMLGVLDVRTSVYRPERDLFADCRGTHRSTLARNSGN